MSMTPIATRIGSTVVAAVIAIGCCLPAPRLRADAVDVQALARDLGLVEASVASRDRPGWRPPRKVLVWTAMPDLARQLRVVAPDVEVVSVRDDEDAIANAAGADIVFGLCSRELLAAGREIRWLQSYWAGVEDCVAVPVVRERGILLTNMQRVAGPVMAEHVLAMMLAFARGLHYYVPQRMAARWTDDPPAPDKLMTLQGKTVLVVGLGGIGSELAKRAHSLGMDVIAIRASGRDGPDYVSQVGLPADLLTFASRADFIVNTTPLTRETTGLFDAKFFDAAKDGAYFFNVGRGPSVVHDDLVAALRSRKLAGAGLDVTDPEPLPAENPLWTMQNVIITPHVSGHADTGLEARYAILRENFRRYAAGEPLYAVVDPERGY
jgi:phosphoglycerate dehydrogenase-like enzyme